MSVGKFIYSVLKNDVAVGPLLLSGSVYKIHPLTGYIEEQAPFVTYQTITQTANNTKAVPSTVDTLRVQVNIIHNTYDDVVDLARKVRTALDYKLGTFEGVQVQYCAFQTSNDTFEDGGKLNGISMVAQEYLIRIVR